VWGKIPFLSTCLLKKFMASSILKLEKSLYNILAKLCLNKKSLALKLRELLKDYACQFSGLYLHW